jgi:hypothetical protein
VHSEIELEFRNVDFYGGRITGVPGEKPSWLRREPTLKQQPKKHYYGINFV